MSSFITIPAGKLVRFKQSGSPLPDTENAKFILEENLTLTMSSSFSNLVNISSPAFMTVLSQEIYKKTGWGSGAISGQYKQFGFQTWKGTAPISFSLTLNIAMVNDAYEDVVKPVMALSKLTLPHELKGGGLIAPGPAPSTAMTKESVNQTDENGNPLITGKQLNCYIGNFPLYNIIIKTAQPTFSSTIDTKGYPIFASIRLEAQTLFTATTAMADSMTSKNIEG